MNTDLKNQDPKQGTAPIDNNLTTLDSRFNQTLRNVQGYARVPIFQLCKSASFLTYFSKSLGFIKGRSFPGKILITRSDPADFTILPSPRVDSSPSENITGSSKHNDDTNEDQVHRSKPDANELKSTISNSENTSKETPRVTMSTRATDTARIMKFTKELGGVNVILDKLRELAWSGVPHYLRPKVWRLLLGYAPPNSDRREGVVGRKRAEYFDCVAQFYDVSDNERTDEEINMLRQIAVDCPRTVPDVTFFQQPEVQKSLERILYTWAIRHPAKHLEGSVDNWRISDLDQETISNIEADCYWCLSKLLDGMQDHYTFAQPGIQRLVFKLKDLVTRIDEPIARHMEAQGLDFLQFSFRWFNCLLIREIPFHLVNRLWDTYLAEGDALPDFLIYIFASFLLTWSKELQKLDFQEMVMFLQHLPTENWGHQELEMVLSRAFMWHTMFNNSPSHLAS
uniref:Rab-GAP TBC domain-containing protein n=1 Tax=Lactuca sativa TaxID=4236 RepID=A0A9R1W8Q6_LACSA|nr:hypothetical protein LSAT_V11C300146690 [Lactuca sativa]